jgi:hypothetical protein
MHPAAKLQFERVVQGYSLWRTIPEDQRSPAPAWWWQSALEVARHHEQMPALSCYRLELAVGSTYADGATTILAPIVTQTSLPWPDEFPRKLKLS